MPMITRFAPSPTGLLHLGHARAALFAARQAGENGRFLLRIEDIDPVRCHPRFEAAIMEDLAWLELDWERPVRRQSAHLDDYAKALDRLRQMGLVYPCFCSRKEIQAELAAAGHAPHGPDGALYPGTCRQLAPAERQRRIDEGDPFALRLDMAEAIHQAGRLFWQDRQAGHHQARPEIFGDVVLARKDTPTSYHLAVCVDDHLQGITLVTRGVDLLEATHVHRLLQTLLDLNTPEYHHHPLLTDAQGRRLAKRDRAQTLSALREAGFSAEAVRRRALDGM